MTLFLMTALHDEDAPRPRLSGLAGCYVDAGYWLYTWPCAAKTTATLAKMAVRRRNRIRETTGLDWEIDYEMLAADGSYVDVTKEFELATIEAAKLAAEQAYRERLMEALEPVDPTEDLP